MNERDELSDTQRDRVAACEQTIGVTFADKRRLWEALVHASSTGQRLDSNERMEFLGDAVLGFVVCDLLYRRYPDWLEGELTGIKSILVSRNVCARIARRLDLERHLVVGKGVTRNQRVPDSLLANIFESIIAAVYLDAGLEAAAAFVLRHLGDHLEAAIGGIVSRNHKAELQQLCQRRFGEAPTYLVLGHSGPDHDRQFHVAAQVAGREFPPAWGPNKKIAEQRAAGNAMAELNGEPPPFLAELSDEPPD